MITLGRHTIPALHCLMPAKTQELYRGVIDSLVAYIPEFRPLAYISVWEQAPRNAFEQVFPQIRIYACLFHNTERIWSKVQKLGLTHGFNSNLEISMFTRLLMTIPFYLPL